MSEKDRLFSCSKAICLGERTLLVATHYELFKQLNWIIVSVLEEEQKEEEFIAFMGLIFRIYSRGSDRSSDKFRRYLPIKWYTPMVFLIFFLLICSPTFSLILRVTMLRDIWASSSAELLLAMIGVFGLQSLQSSVMHWNPVAGYAQIRRGSI